MQQKTSAMLLFRSDRAPACIWWHTKYSIPPTALHDHQSGKSTKISTGGPTMLTSSEKRSFDMHVDMSYVPTQDVVAGIVRDYLHDNASANPLSDRVPGKNSGRDSWSGGHQWVKESHNTSPHRGQTQEFPRSSMHGSTKRWISSWVQALTCPILLLHNACEIAMRAFFTSVSAITGKNVYKKWTESGQAILASCGPPNRTVPVLRILYMVTIHTTIWSLSGLPVTAMSSSFASHQTPHTFSSYFM